MNDPKLLLNESFLGNITDATDPRCFLFTSRNATSLRVSSDSSQVLTMLKQTFLRQTDIHFGNCFLGSWKIGMGAMKGLHYVARRSSLSNHPISRPKIPLALKHFLRSTYGSHTSVQHSRGFGRPAPRLHQKGANVRMRNGSTGQDIFQASGSHWRMTVKHAKPKC